MKKDTTQPPTEKPLNSDTLENVYPLKATDKKVATIMVFDDGYVSVGIYPATKKALKVGDRVKNAIKAMIKEGYSVRVENVTQTEIPF